MASAATRSGTSASGAFERGGRRGQRRFHLAGMLQRLAAGERRDPPRAGRDALFADDLEQADLAGVVQVRAAAQLLAELAHRDHPHDVRILLAEEHHRAGLAGLGDRQRASNCTGSHAVTRSFTSCSIVASCSRDDATRDA